MTKDEKNLVFKQYQKLVEAQVWKIIKRNPQADKDDLQAQAYYIFCKALDDWNSERASLNTFLFATIRNGLLNYIYRDEYQKKVFCYSERVEAEEPNEVSVELSANPNPIIRIILQAIREIPAESNMPYKSIYHGWLDKYINSEYGYTFAEIWKTYPDVKKILREA